MDLLGLRVVALLNAMDAGVLGAAQAEHALSPLLAGMTDPDEVFGLGERLGLRIGLAQVPRRLPGGWALALVAPGRLGGLRGPAATNRDALALEPDDLVGAAAIAVRHAGGAALLPGWQRTGDEDWRVLRVAPAERPLSPPTPQEAGRALLAAMGSAAQALGSSGLVTGGRPDAASTVALGAAYPAGNQTLLDRAMTVLAAVATAEQQSAQLPHAHAVGTRAAHLGPLRAAALDAVQSALSWPTHLMV